MKHSKTKKMLALIIAIAIIAALVAGCGGKGGGGTQTATGGDGGSNFGGSINDDYYLVPFLSGGEYWFPVFAGFKEAAIQLGVNSIYLGSVNYDAAEQVDVFNQIIAQNPKGIALCPLTPDPFVEPINRAIDSGIPVVTFATDSPDSKRLALITSDNVNEGTISARTLGEAMGGQGKVLVLRNPGQLNHDIRCDVFIEVIEREFPGITVVADEPSRQDSNAAYNAFLTTAQVHPDIGGVFAPECISAMAAAMAAIELWGNTDQIKVVSVDVTPQFLDMIKEGQVTATIAPDQGMQGLFSMLTLFCAANPDFWNPMNGKKEMGKNPIEIPFIDNGLTVVNKDNADFFYTDKFIETHWGTLDNLLAPLRK